MEGSDRSEETYKAEFSDRSGETNNSEILLERGGLVRVCPTQTSSGRIQSI